MKANVENANGFLKSKHIAVAGVSRTGNSVGNAIVKKLLSAGYEVFPVNPHATTIDGVACYYSLTDVPGELDGVVITTHQKDSADVVRDAIHRGIRNIWFHKGIGAGSMSAEALRECYAAGINPIEGGCPMMFIQPVDVFHKCLKFFST